jgi:hypothetical protein
MNAKEDTTTANVALPATGNRPHDNSDTMIRRKKFMQFDVNSDTFRKFETGRNRFERWSKYLNLQDDSEKAIYDYAMKNRDHTIVLRNGDTGAMRSIRRRALNEADAKMAEFKGFFKPVDTQIDYDAEQLTVGIEVESEHTPHKEIATIIAKHHLAEDPDYYVKLKKYVEKKGA